MQNCYYFTSTTMPMSTQVIPAYSQSLRRPALLVSIVAQICLVLFGCVRDPNARKQKLLEQGDRYFAQEKFPEALVTYGRALQIEPKSALLHSHSRKRALKHANGESD